MNKKPRTAAFKKKIAIEALREDNTIEEIAKEHSLHRVQVCKWKKELLGSKTHIIYTLTKSPYLHFLW